MNDKPTAAGADPQPILDAASILLIDRAAPAPRVLMGRRQATNVFLPNKWVFPGGRLEASDANVPCADDLDRADAHALAARPLPSTPKEGLPRALALAAVRELFEETGHALARPMPSGGERPQGESPVQGHAVVWQTLALRGLAPSIAPLRFLARAITPPLRTRRYDTRFFLADRLHVTEDAGAADQEFSDLAWFTIADARALDLPAITRRILGDLEDALRRQPEEPAGPVPFYYEEEGIYRRDVKIGRAHV